MHSATLLTATWQWEINHDHRPRDWPSLLRDCVAARGDRMNSTNVMVDRLAGMLGTADLNDFETGFVESMVAIKDRGKITALTERQIEILERIHGKHFA